MKLDGKTIKESLEQLVEEYKFEPHQVLDIVKRGIKSAFRRDYLSGEKKVSIQINIDKDGNIKVYREYTVVNEVEDPAKEMSFNEAQKHRKDVKEGETILTDITPENLEFSRIAVQSAAQTIKQNLKKVERERFYEKFQDKQGELLKAKVLRVSGDNVVLDINGNTVVLSPEGQVPNKVYTQGEELWVLLRKISKEAGGITLDITQAGNDFVESILHKMVPELEEGTVKIEKIVRIAGKKTKVAVSSDDERVDPVGVFVGQHGERISNILEILNGEKIDFIEYKGSTEELIREALKPATVENIEISEDKASVDIKEGEKAMAIGKNAVNVKLTSQLAGMKIDVN